MTAGYAANRIVVARREHRDAFAVFGRAVVKEAAEHNWRYAVVGGEDEGMALYVRRTEFLEPDQAASEWNAGKLDALVVPEEELAELLPRLPGAVPSTIGFSEPAGSGRRRYLFWSAREQAHRTLISLEASSGPASRAPPSIGRGGSRGSKRLLDFAAAICRLASD